MRVLPIRCLASRGCACELSTAANRPAARSLVLATRSTAALACTRMVEELDVSAGTMSAALKLNLCDYRSPSSGAVTTPAFVAAVVAALRQRCPDLHRITLVEGDSSGTRANDLYALLGFRALADELSLELLDPSCSTWRRVGVVGGLPVEVPELIFGVDLFVNLPKMKLHGKTGFTGALKNNFGLLERRWKVPYHARLCEAIISSNRDLPRQLTLMDGTTTVSGRGPAYGVPARLGVVLGSWDPVAVDAAGARLLGVPLPLAGHIPRAERAGLGSIDYELRWAPGHDLCLPRLHTDWFRFAAANVLRRS